MKPELSLIDKLDALKGVKPLGYERKLALDLENAAQKLYDLLEIKFYAKHQIFALFEEELKQYEVTAKKFYSLLKTAIDNYKKKLEAKASEKPEDAKGQKDIGDQSAFTEE